jgi:hypothetical protein
MDEEFDDINRLREAYRNERSSRLKLEEECDLLAEENIRLNREIVKLKALLLSSSIPSSSSDPRDASSRHPDIVHSSITGSAAAEVLVRRDGDGLFANRILTRIPRACGDKNVLSASFLINQHAVANQDIVVCGGVDGNLSLYDADSSTLLRQFMIGAPVLTLSIWETRIAASMMDGSVAIVSAFPSLGRSYPLIRPDDDE